MCGIHGFINGKTKADANSDDFIKSAFVANMLRGVDSSGIGVVSSDGFSDVCKVPLAGMYLPTSKHAQKLISRSRQVNTASMCHVRAATVGDVNYQNAHPFVVEDDAGNTIVGIHNGTLYNWTTKEGGKDFDVDSAWAMSRILDKGRAAFDQFNGAFAFVWWTSEQPGVLNMARNKERPLFVAFTEDNNLVYASEAGMLHWLCERHRIKLKGSLKELEEGHMFSFAIDNPHTYTKEILPVYKVPASTHSSNTYGTGYGSYHEQYYKTAVEKMDEIFANVRAENDGGVQLTLVPNQDNSNNLVTKEEVQEAFDMDMLGCKGTFTAVGADDKSGYLYGTFESDSYRGEMNSVMRDVPEDIDWASNGSWEVKVQGINDSGNDFIIIVSKPLTEAVAN